MRCCAAPPTRETDLPTSYEPGNKVPGTPSNVVPDEAEAVVDFRVLVPAENERVSAAIHGLKPVTPGTSLEISGGLNRPPFPNDERMQATFAHAQQIAAGIGVELKASGSGGASGSGCGKLPLLGSGSKGGA